MSEVLLLSSSIFVSGSIRPSVYKCRHHLTISHYRVYAEWASVYNHRKSSHHRTIPFWLCLPSLPPPRFLVHVRSTLRQPNSSPAQKRGHGPPNIDGMVSAGIPCCCCLFCRCCHIHRWWLFLRGLQQRFCPLRCTHVPHIMAAEGWGERVLL